MEEYLLPYLKFVDPTLDKYGMLQQCSLYNIRAYLESSEKIVLIGNRDDVILDKDDLKFIDTVFGERAKLFDWGGHCGNIMFTPFVEAMIGMVKP